MEGLQESVSVLTETPSSFLSSLQWPCGVGHTGEQSTGVEGGATASATVSGGEGWDRMGYETHSILGSEDKPKESTVFPVPTGT